MRHLSSTAQNTSTHPVPAMEVARMPILVDNDQQLAVAIEDTRRVRQPLTFESYKMPVKDKAFQCTYINRKGVRCTVHPKVPLTVDLATNRPVPVDPVVLCSIHKSRLPTFECTFPGCKLRTYSKTKMCNFHPTLQTEKLIAELDKLNISKAESEPVHKGCDYKKSNGILCGRPAATLGRCAYHLGSRQRHKCKNDSCGSLTTSASGYCAKHRYVKKSTPTNSPPTNSPPSDNSPGSSSGSPVTSSPEYC